MPGTLSPAKAALLLLDGCTGVPPYTLASRHVYSATPHMSIVVIASTAHAFHKQILVCNSTTALNMRHSVHIEEVGQQREERVLG